MIRVKQIKARDVTNGITLFVKKETHIVTRTERVAGYVRIYFEHRNAIRMPDNQCLKRVMK